MNLLLGNALKGLGMIAVFMTIGGYAILVERKLAARIQGRPGPNRTAPPLLGYLPWLGGILTRLGLFQPVADIGKFIFKEEPVPGHVKKFYYTFAPVVAFIPAILTMAVLPVGQINGRPIVLANLDVGILFMLAVTSLGFYGIILAGWSSNSKYPFLGAVRSSAQLISYELGMGLSVLPVFMAADGTLNLGEIVLRQKDVWFGFWMPLSALIFLVSLFAETNRLPFDMPEADTELVAGYNTEYGAFKFGLFFVAEYMNVTIGSGVFTVLFLGGWNLPFVTYPDGLAGAVFSLLVFLLKVFALIFLFMWVRWTLPRFRYDQTMKLGWTILLPVALFNLLFYTVAIAVYEKIF